MVNVIIDVLPVNTNQGELELYAVIGEQDNRGFPLAYCLVSTASSVADSKHQIALTAFLSNLRNAYDLQPHFIHTNKDIAEIHAAQTVWPESKHQLCWWHLREALRRRLAKAKLSTTPYDAARAHAEFSFINIEFIPSSRPDKNEDEAAESTSPRSQARCTTNDPPALASIPVAPGPNSLLVKLPIIASFKASHPPLPKDANPAVEELPITSDVFCPSELRKRVITMVEQHLCMHPSIPGISAPTVAGIREASVRQMYCFCQENGLQSLWAYMWENWYRNGRWELWARAPCREIPRLKTTMLCESQ